MKELKFLLLGATIVLFSGCGVSNWNLGNEAPNMTSQKTTQKISPTPPPQSDEITLILDDEIAINDENSQNSESNQSKEADRLYKELQNPTKPAKRVVLPPKNGLYHITAIIEAWGEPNSKGPNEYVWKSCKATGEYKEECDASSCRTIPLTKCCDRVLKTDNGGYVKNLSTAIEECN